MSKQYTQAFKDQVIHERLKTKTTIKSLSAKVVVGTSTINKWLKVFRHSKIIKQSDECHSSGKICQDHVHHQ